MPTMLPRILACAALCGFAPLAAEEYSLGVVLSLTGAGSMDCKEDLEGIQLAVDEINAAGGLLKQHPIRLTVKDDQGKPDVSASQAKALLAEAKPRAVIGVWSSGCALAVKPIFTEAKVLMIAGHSNSEDITRLNPSPYVYSVVPNTYMMARAIAVSLAKTAKEKGWKSYATLASDYAFGKSLQGNVVANLKELAPELVMVEAR
jgi:branched-chain amino acid transport system substrate-binding protein